MSTNKELSIEHLTRVLAQLNRARPASADRALYVGMVIGVASAYRNVGILDEADLAFLPEALSAEDALLPVLMMEGI